MARPLILLTNDDGYKAKGIQSLIEPLREFGDVVMVAPSFSQSGKAGSITVQEPLRLKKISEEEGLSIYRCTGTPVDSVKVAIAQILDRKPDLIVSGINHGVNSSVSVHYSGTMGAAIEGAINNIPSIGFSLTDYHSDADFSQSQVVAKEVVADVLKNGLPIGICLNVNIPKGEVKGIKTCRQANGKWVEEFEKRTDPAGRDYYWLTGYFKDHEPESQDTDEWALKNNYASLVPIRVDVTAHALMDEFRSRYNGKTQ